MTDLSWMDRGRCTETGDDLHFPEKGHPTKGAKMVCHGCEVRQECLEYALENQEKFGIWGGLSERERRRMRGSAA
jgi:WhiB family transcriptional regulator, redox-sensing transcriptional regulator